MSRFSLVLWLLSALVSSLFSAHASEMSEAQAIGVRDAAHLLRRVGIGADPVAVIALSEVSRQEAIDVMVDGIQSQPSIPMPQWVTAPAPPYWARGDMTRQDRLAFNQARDREVSDLRRWWVAEMIATPSPQTERLVLMWHNHFVSAYSGIDEESTSIARQNQMLRERGLGNFRELLKAVIRDAAMLNYLDNRSNRKKSPNENLARELMELFTLGEGQYDEYTVKEAARALTGYSVAVADDMSFTIQARRQDSGEKTLFGKSGNFDGDDLVDIILEQPAAAEHIARLFWRTYISESNYSESGIVSLAATFRDSGYELKELLIATLQRPEFWAEDYRGHIIKSPVDLLLGTIRSTGYVPLAWESLPGQLARLGQSLFDPPNVAGWKGGAAWVTPARLLNRRDAMARLFNAGTPKQELRADASDSAMMSAPLAADMSNGMSNSMAGDMPASGNGNGNGNGSSSDGMMSNSMSAPATDNRLRVKLASEDFRGAPKIRVVLRQNKKSVWDSGEYQMLAGHDTERFGPLSDGDVMPWQVLDFLLPTALAPFNRVDVHFLNDAAGDGGDRNLYVDWVSVHGVDFYARTGRQESGCPPDQDDQAGELYCQGYVSIPAPAQMSGKPAGKLQLVVSGAYTWWFGIPEKNADWRQLVIGLSDVQFESRYWDTLAFSIVSSRDLGPGIEIKTTGCVEDCFEQWPECAWTNATDPDHRSLFFPLQRTAANVDVQCHWDSLAEEDQRLVSSLYQLLPDIVAVVADGPKAARRESVFNAWLTAIKKFQAKLDPVYRLRHAAKKLVVTGDNIAHVSQPLILPQPITSGRSWSQTNAALQTLLQRGNTEVPLLLAISPSSVITAKRGSRDLTVLLADPSYQVR